MINKIEVNSERNHKVPKSFVYKVIRLLKKDLHFKISSVTVNFVSASEITAINKEYLNHPYSTDIITFNYSENISNIDTEIFISVDDAAENAAKYKIPYIEEILRLIIHGILHVTGYDDIKPGEKAKMKRIENKLLNSYKMSLLAKKETYDI